MGGSDAARAVQSCPQGVGRIGAEIVRSQLEVEGLRAVVDDDEGGVAAGRADTSPAVP